MIPQRVAIEGFLSYRQQVEFCFDGAPIWMLTGKNGAGKSSVFDAITFALYGVHRGGKDEVKELINRSSDRLMVEFDFLLGEDRYRVQRIVARKGSPAFQAWYLSGPNPPKARIKGEQAIDGTDSKAGLNAWVKGKLGLDDEAFKMSALLEQGKSDALLSADPKDRHKLLSQLVDLRRYKVLEEEAKQRLAGENGVVKANRAELANLSPVTPSQIAEQEERVAQSKQQIDLIRQRLEQLQALMVHAQEWSKLGRQRDDTLARLATMRSLLADADAIEAAALRLGDLQSTLPALRRILRHRQDQARYQVEAAAHRQNAAKQAATVAEVTPRVEEKRVQLMQLQEDRDAAQGVENGALQRLNELSPAIHDLKEMERLQQKIASCDEQLALFALDLDEQLAQAQAEVEERRLLKVLWPYAQQYVAARTSWLENGAKLEEAQQQQAEETKVLAQATLTVAAAHATVTEASEALGISQSRSAVAESGLKEAKEQLRKFEAVGAQPICPYCGQPLSHAHLVSERARLEKIVADASAAAKEATAALALCRRQAREAEVDLGRCQSERERSQKSERERQSLCQALMGERSRAESDGRRALYELHENQAPASLLPNADEIVACFALAEPAADDLDLLYHRVQGLGAVEKALQSVQATLTEREGFRSSRQHLQSQWQQLATSYPQVRVEAIRHEHAETEQARATAKSNVAALTPQLEEAKEALRLLDGTLQHAKSGQQEAEQSAASAERMAQDAQGHWGQESDALSPTWQTMAREVESRQIAELQREEESLKGAEVRLEQLRTATSQIAMVKASLTVIEEELAKIPQEARQEVESLQQEELQARARHAQEETEHQAVINELDTLKKRCFRIEELTTALRAAEKKASHYTLIAKFLGNDYLQRFLLQEAEHGIVEQANALLDRCSGGALSLELRPQPKEGKVQKAFELMVENHETQSIQAKMLPAWLLSGSQRFRVAISLALAIGHYASSNHQRIESVIIDEGFGSLDHEGLSDMEEALRSLDGVIKRIILVSHQEEFAKAFSHRYAVWLENGASQAGLADDGLEAR